MRAIVTAALLTGLLGSWLGFAVTGWRGAVDVLGALLVLGALAGRAALRAPRPPRRRHASSPPPPQYPSYERLAGDTRLALSDGRFAERVAAPRLRTLAQQIAEHRTGRPVTDTELAERLGAPARELLAPPPRPRDRDEPITPAELDAVLSAIEQL
jgi:hypothetical protein